MSARVCRGIAVVCVCAAAAAALISGCGSSTPATPSGAVVTVSERDFHIATSVSAVQAGTVRLRVHNAGPDQHELIVLPLRPAAAAPDLPQRSDGFTVDEERLQSREPGSINPQEPGGTEDLTVQLRPGRYVLFCNMAGHFMSGMHTVLVVTE